MKRMGLAGVVLAVVFLTMAASAWAESTITTCVPYLVSTGKLATGKPIVAGTETGTCKNTSTIKYHPLNIPAAGGFETLNKLLAHMTFVESGVGGKPTIQFSGVNVQLLSGAGNESTVNGEGNLIVGYDQSPKAQTGSNNLVVGTESQEFTSYGGLLAGENNHITAPFASVSGGVKNTASGESSSVSGGITNTASGEESSVSGGWENKAKDSYDSILGGEENVTEGLPFATVSGGLKNTVSGEWAVVSGGRENKASGESASVGGGYKNTAGFRYSSIFGGKGLSTAAEYEAIP